MAKQRLVRQRAAVEGIERPLVTVDVAIFTVREGALRVLLVRRPDDPAEPFPGRWALPGGFVDIARDASLEDAARRKLAEKTGVLAPYLEQLASFGDAGRDPRGWSTTHAYFALIASDQVVLEAGGNAPLASWRRVEGRGVRAQLAFDHARILAVALERLRNKVEYTSLPVYLLPAEFTLVELQGVYETVLGRAVEKSAFRRRMLAAGFIEPVERMQAGRTRPARLYRLRSSAKLVFFPRTFNPSRRQNPE